MSTAKSGGGSTMNKNTSPLVRTGAPSKGSSPAAAGQLGASTAFRKDQVDAGRGYDGAKLGNELATNVGKGGPGTGRTVMPCGSQGQHGPVGGTPRPAGPDILSQYGPEKSKG